MITRWQNTLNKGYINEIFSSYQGEGKYIGARQIFVRLSGCKIGCIDCDTENQIKDSFWIEDKEIPNPVTPEKLVELIINSYDLNLFHSISVTGGEPLEQLEFVKSFANLIKRKDILLFLETSGFYPEKLLNIEGLFDILSIDIKLLSVFGVKFSTKLFELFESVDKSKYYFKLVVNESISFIELNEVINALKLLNIKHIYIQPHNDLISEIFLNKLFSVLSSGGITAFYVPQVHKLIRIR